METIPDLEKKLYDTEQRLENVQALLDIVCAKVIVLVFPFSVIYVSGGWIVDLIQRQHVNNCFSRVFC